MTLSEMADQLGLACLTPELADGGPPAPGTLSLAGRPAGTGWDEGERPRPSPLPSPRGGEGVSAPEGRGAAAEVSRGHVGDLLSDVLANAPRGGVLVTIQTHLNVIAVALNAEVAAVIFAWGRTPEEAVRRKAAEEGIRLYGSRASAFDIVGRLYALGVRGTGF